MKHVVFLTAALFATVAFGASSKSFEASYTGTIANVPPSTPSLNVWLPLPVTRGNQIVSDVEIEGPYKWTRRRDTFGNEYAFTTIDHPPAGDLSFTVRFNATRREATMDAPAERQMLTGVATFDAELAGRLELAGVAVGSAVQHHDRRTRRHLDVTDGGGDSGDAEVSLHRALEAQHLLDEVGDERPVVTQALLQPRVFGEQLQRRGQQPDRRLLAGSEQVGRQAGDVLNRR